MSDNGGPRIWNRRDLLALVDAMFDNKFVPMGPTDFVRRLTKMMEMAEAPLLAGGVSGLPPLFPSSTSGPAPRIWSRDDFVEAHRIAKGTLGEDYVRAACRVLAHAERHARIVVPQPRDEKGHYVKRPKLAAGDEKP